MEEGAETFPFKVSRDAAKPKYWACLLACLAAPCLLGTFVIYLHSAVPSELSFYSTAC